MLTNTDHTHLLFKIFDCTSNLSVFVKTTEYTVLTVQFYSVFSWLFVKPQIIYNSYSSFKDAY